MSSYGCPRRKTARSANLMLRLAREGIISSHGPHKKQCLGWGHHPISERTHKEVELRIALKEYAEYEADVRHLMSLPKETPLDPDREYYRARDRMDRARADDAEVHELYALGVIESPQTMWR
ncbi:MAG: hypothetical protein WC455_12945 [Dehalococcoidia bacterium]